MLKAFCIALHLCTSISGNPSTVDGDTIRFDGINVRILGLDAPEMSEPYGYESRMALYRLVRNGARCDLTGDKSYHRYVGQCFNADGDIAAQMIAQGLALDCGRYSGELYRKYEPANIRLKLSSKPYCR